MKLTDIYEDHSTVSCLFKHVLLSFIINFDRIKTENSSHHTRSRNQTWIMKKVDSFEYEKFNLSLQ